MAKGSIKFSIEGIKAAQKLLKQLPKTANDKVLYDINRAGAQIVKKELEQAAPEGNNDNKSADKIASNVIIKRVKGSKTAVSIGFAKKVFWVRFIEFGTKIRQTLGKGKYKKGAKRGRVTRKPFIQQAHNAAFPKVVDFFQKNFLKIVNKSLKKQIKRVNKKKR